MRIRDHPRRPLHLRFSHQINPGGDHLQGRVPRAMVGRRATQQYLQQPSLFSLQSHPGLPVLARKLARPSRILRALHRARTMLDKRSRV